MLAFAGVVVAPVLGACSKKEGNGAKVDVPAFKQQIAKQGAVVLDVRTPGEFAAGHLEGAKLIDVNGADFDAQIAQLDKAVPYAVYCRSGNRSGTAINKMVKAGFSDTVHLSGGIGAWQSQSGAVVQG